MKNKTPKNFFENITYIKALIIILLVSLVLEVFVFNFRTFESLTFRKISPVSVKYGSENAVVKNGSEEVKLRSAADLTFTMENINEYVKNIMLDVTVSGTEVIPVALSATDEGNSSYRSFPQTEVTSYANSSKYIKLNLAGKAKDIKAVLKNTANCDVTVKSIALNEKVPFSFSFFRFALVFIILSLFYTIRPSSKIYNAVPDEKRQKKYIFIFLAVNILILLLFVNLNPVFKNPAWQHHKQYAELAAALSKGHFYLDEEPSKELISLNNPYDFYERQSKLKNSNCLWDHAYFEGKYYVYFGIVPCLLYYLPFYAVTGSHIPTYLVIFINTSLCAIGITLLLREILKKKFPKTPFAVYLILCQMMITGGGIWLSAKRPDFYFVPIVTATMLTLFGLLLWIKADKGKKLSVSHLVFGSLFMALVAGSRPQFVLGSFFIFVIFYKSFKDKKILSKNSVAQTMAVAIPYAAVAAGLMYYNFARFGSPFDFGANYNLTFNDMTLRGIRSDRTFLGIFTYLFQPPQITAAFPFLEPTKISTAYQGTTIYEEMFGGYFLTNPFVWFCALAVFAKKYFEDKKCLIASIMCFAFALIIVFADTQMAGILTRYVADFGLFLYFGAAVCFACLYKSTNDERLINVLKTALVLCFAFTFFYNILLIFTETGESIRACNPKLYYVFKYLTAFWL